MDMMMMDSAMGGHLMMGTWYNPKTGDSFTVRDTFFEDNNLIVMTTDGRRMDYNMISQYVKSDKPIPKQVIQAPVRTQQVQSSSISSTTNEELPAELQEILAEDTTLYQTQPLQQKVQKAQVQQEPYDEDTLLINRMLKKANKPEVKCSIKWQGFPYKQLEMLEMMAVEPEKIASYFAQSIDLEALREKVIKEIASYIENKGSLDSASSIEPVDNCISVPFCQLLDEDSCSGMTPIDTSAISDMCTTNNDKVQVYKPKKEHKQVKKAPNKKKGK